MSRWCKECGVKLAARNSKRRTSNGYKDRLLCQPCFINPKEEMRCVKITAAGNRCKHRKSDDSERGYCAFHEKRSK